MAIPKGVNHAVCFNPDIAWTLAYDDAHGRLIFVFEPGDTEKKITLHRIPLENDRVVQIQNHAMRVRIDEAFERTKEYLISCGYDVDAY